MTATTCFDGGTEIESKVLDAVDCLLARGKYRQMDVEMVARETGIAKSKLYLNFRTREDLLLALSDRAARRILLVESEIASEPRSSRGRIQEILLFRILAYFDSVQHFTDSIDDIFGDIRTELLERRRVYTQWEAEILESILKEGKILATAECNFAGTARLLLRATDSLLPFNCVSAALGTRRRLAKRAAALSQLLTNGLLCDQYGNGTKPTLSAVRHSKWTRKLPIGLK